MLRFLSAATALLIVHGTMAIAQGDRPRNLYVIEISGTWTASAAKDNLKLFTPVSTSARLRLTAGDPYTSRIVLRDPRTLSKHTRECSSAKPCDGLMAVSDIKPEPTGLAATAKAAGLYADLGERSQLRDRVRLVGARGTERDIGIVVLTREGVRVEVREITARVQQPTDRLVARFCSLSDANLDENECIESRRRAPSDCDLTAPHCELPAGDSVGAYRVDVYVRERSMLGSVAVASGFAAVVPIAARDSAAATRDELAQIISELAAGLLAEELRGLTAAATLTVAGYSR